MIATYGRIKQQRVEREKDGGFTLIELLIVIVVLGILAAIVVFSLGTITGKSAVAACEADAQQANTGIAAFYAGTGAYATTQAAMSPTYLQTWPNNPNHYVITYTGTTTTYTLTVKNPTTAVVATISDSPAAAGIGAVAACTTLNLVA